MIARIGKYTIEAELGHGGFGQVYKAWDPDFRQSVAIKVLLAEGNPDLLKRFGLEVVTTASLHHKNIVTTYASGEEGGTPYLVMELLEGQTLGQLGKLPAPLSLMDKVRIINEVADGLAYAHSRGVVHRDIKPANIMLLNDGSVKIMDFGIALAANRPAITVTMEGFVVGTVAYLAPELFTSTIKADEQTDVYSFGVVCYELLTGRHPYESSLHDPSALRLAILTQQPEALGKILDSCPDALELLVHRALAKEREFRYQKFEELRLDSEAILVDLQHDQAGAILQDVPALVNRGELTAARAKVREAQKLEPGNRTARQLLETVDQKLREILNRERVAARLTEAERQIAQSRFAEAVQTLETASRLDTGNVAVRMRLAEARSRLESSLQADRLVEEARARQQRGELAEAVNCLNRALQIDPQHAEALRLRPRISQQAERHQHDQVRLQALGNASDHMEAKRYAEALVVLDEFERTRPGAPGVADLRARIEAEKAEEERRVRAERFQLAVFKTRETIQAGDVDLAVQMLTFLNANFADEPGASELLPLLRKRLDALVRQRDIAACQQHANDLLARRSFEEAAEFLNRAAARFPEDAELARQRASARALAAAVKRSAAAPAQSSPGPHTTETELQHRRYKAGLRGLLEAGRALMAANKYAEVISRIAEAPEYSGDADVLALLDSARMAAGAEEERKFAGDAISASENMRQRGEWKQALSTLEGALLKYPNNAELAQSLDRTRGEFERYQHGRAIQQHRATILSEIQGKEWQKAQAAVDHARADFPDEVAFDELSAEVEIGLREDGLREVASQVRAKLAARNFPAALRQLEETRSVFSHNPQWKALERELARRRAYEDGLLEIERKRRGGNLAEAESAASQLVSGALDERASQALQLMREQRAESEAVAAKVRDSLNRHEIREAASALAAGRARYPDESLWVSLQVEIDVQQEQLREQEAIAGQIRECLKRDDIRGAAAKLAEGRSLYHNETLWNNLRLEIDARKDRPGSPAQRDDTATLAAGAQPADIAASVRKCLERDDIRQAAVELGAAGIKERDESLWTSLKTEIETRQAQLARREYVAAIAQRVRQRLGRGALKQAAVELNAARAKYPEEEMWTTLQAEIDSATRSCLPGAP